VGLLTAEGIVAGYSAADVILKGVDLTLDAGEIVCVIGPNGAGKSTLLHLISGFLEPSRGAVTVGGDPAWRNPQAYTRLGLVPERPSAKAWFDAFRNRLVNIWP